ncbi:MAG: helix-turn-helix domain-containing protein, partial [Anaerolineae bacterium]
NMITTSATLKLLHLQSHLPTWHRLMTQREAMAEDEGAKPASASGMEPSAASEHPAPSGEDLAASQATLERQVITEALTQSQGHVTRAAKSIGISRQLLHYKMKKHGLRRSDFTPNLG